MNFRATTAALFLGTILLASCGDNRAPQANQPIGSNPYYYGNGQTVPVNGQPQQQPQPTGDYYSWYCAYDPSSCYGDYNYEYTGCDSGCGGTEWNAEFYFGSQVARR